jgi:aspartyl-tRNA(Asn)/glutamyl-tRNA(Gln) amidotransferase subunit A
MNNIQALHSAFSLKKTKPSEFIENTLKKIKKQDSKIHSFLELQEEKTLKRAKELDSKIESLKDFPLLGVPIAIKDNILVKDWKATAGSKILENYISPYTATCVEKLEKAGAIVIGKTNCDEFAMGSSNENSAYGLVSNPWNLDCVPGGSSGGSAAATASAFCLGALGTDTGGSIRQPASFCGVVGLKPSYGRVSRYGVIAYASSLDQVGPFSKNVWDSARLLEILSGYDKYDATSSTTEVPKYTQLLEQKNLKNTKFGIDYSWLEGIDPEISTAFKNSVEILKKAGAQIIDIKIPNTKYALSTYYLIAPAEASSNLARYDGVHYGHQTTSATDGESLYSKSRGEGFGKEVKLRIMLGTYALSSGYYDAYYMKANQVRNLLKQDFYSALEKCDCILSPTAPTTAFKKGAKSEDPITMYLNDVYTLPVNLAGLPAISVPCGFDSNKLPMGLQFIGRNFDELTLLQMAYQFEKILGEFPLPDLEGGY